MSQDTEGVYLSQVTITDFHCFKGENIINFTRPDGRYQQWNVILGNNNTGKTTLLRLLSGLGAEIKTVNENQQKIISPYASLYSFLYYDHFFTFKVGSQVNGKVKTKDNFSLRDKWGYMATMQFGNKSFIDGTHKISPHPIQNLIFYTYGLSRKTADTIPKVDVVQNDVRPLFFEDYELINVEEWLLQLDYAAKSNVPNAQTVLEKLKSVLTNGLLPDVKNIELKSELDSGTNIIKNYALFDTDYGKVRLKDLGYGYQSTMAWVIDLAKKMFERYPKLDNPLTGAAIVLVDEIDLHLHPDWQRKIVKHLSGIFPNTQFIVTAHSPLIVQSADDINLIILEKGNTNAGKNGQTHIRQAFGTFQGWTVEEILQDLMGLGDKTLSDKYLKELQAFEDGLDAEDYEKAKAAYEVLLTLLHPTSSQRKLLKLQLGAIAPATV